MLELDYARRAERRAVEMSCEIIGPHWDGPLRHEVRDLSVRGMWVRTSFPLEVGQHVIVSVPGRLGGIDHELTVFARVTRVARPGDRGPYGMALEFVDMTAGERRALAVWLASERIRSIASPPVPPAARPN